MGATGSLQGHTKHVAKADPDRLPSGSIGAQQRGVKANVERPLSSSAGPHSHRAKKGQDSTVQYPGHNSMEKRPRQRYCHAVHAGESANAIKKNTHTECT